LERDALSMLEELEEIVDRGTKIPLSGKVLIDDSLVFDLIDRIRAALPEEIKDAQWIINERQRIMDEAQSESRRLMEQGKSYAEKLAEESEISKQAQAYAEDLVKQAQNYAQEVKNGALQYADELFQYTENKLTETYQALKHNREELKNRAVSEEG
jgi:cell division septum initiation protein DivIVA